MSLLPNEDKEVRLIKPNGQFLMIKAEIQPDCIFVYDVKCPVEVGDIIENILPNGTKQHLLITAIHFDNGSDCLQPLYELSYCINTNQKINPLQMQIGNISAERVYVNSTDNSLNVVGTDSEILTKFHDILSELRKAGGDTELIVSLLEEMKLLYGKKGYKQKFNDFISNAANYITVIQPFLGWLTNGIIG